MRSPGLQFAPGGEAGGLRTRNPPLDFAPLTALRMGKELPKKCEKISKSAALIQKQCTYLGKCSNRK